MRRKARIQKLRFWFQFLVIENQKLDKISLQTFLHERKEVDQSSGAHGDPQFSRHMSDSLPPIS